MGAGRRRKPGTEGPRVATPQRPRIHAGRARADAGAGRAPAGRSAPGATAKGGKALNGRSASGGRDLEQLRQELLRTTWELDFLKEAMALLAKAPRS